MFLDDVPPVHYVDPWKQTLESRIQAIRRRSATRRIGYFYDQPDTSTFRYRVYNMIQCLDDGRGDTAAAWFEANETDRLIELLPMLDALVICRARYSHLMDRLITRAKALGCVTVFDCDDLIFNVDYTHLILHTLDQELYEGAWEHWFAAIGRIGATAKMCDRAIVTNAFLADKMREFVPGRDVRLIPNFLNREQMELSRRIRDVKAYGKWRRDGRIHVGYFSGTPTHNKDFAIVTNALARLFERDDRLVLRLVGFMDTTGELAQYADRIDRHELTDFLNLQRLIGGTELNLVPLQDNGFTNCKSELKYFEAAITGTVTLASPTHVYREIIREGENGYLVNSIDWETKIGAAIERLDDYEEMVEPAIRHAEATYSWSNMMPAIRAAVLGNE